MEKEFRLTSLTLEGVNPSLEEVTSFSVSSSLDNGRNLSALNAALANVQTDADFEIGETVEVVEGDLINLPGEVVSIQNGIVTVKPQPGFGIEVNLVDFIVLMFCGGELNMGWESYTRVSYVEIATIPCQAITETLLRGRTYQGGKWHA